LDLEFDVCIGFLSSNVNEVFDLVRRSLRLSLQFDIQSISYFRIPIMHGAESTCKFVSRKSGMVCVGFRSF